MNTITALPPSTSILQRLFDQMPESFNKEPLETSAVIFYIDSSKWNAALSVSVMISDGKLYVYSTISTIFSEIVELKNHTIDSLCTYFMIKYYSQGIMASPHPELPVSDRTLSATSLSEGVAEFTDSVTIWPKFNNVNYAFLMPFAMALADSRQNMENSLRQTDQRLAGGQWADFWGHLLNVDRLTSEILNDIAYRNRVQRQVVYPKVNNVALSSLLSSSLSTDINVLDGGAPLGLANLSTDKGFASTASATGLASISQGSTSLVISTSSITGTLQAGQLIVATGIPAGTVLLIVGTNSSGSTTCFISQPALTAKTNTSVSFYAQSYPITLPIVGNAFGYGTVTSGSNQLVIGTSPSVPQGYFRSLGATVLQITGTNVPANTTITVNAGNNAEGKNGTYVLSQTISPAVTSTLIKAIANGYTIDDPDLAFTLGPSTGAGSFVVYVNTPDASYTLTQQEYSLLYSLINQWKPAGISFTVQVQ